MDLSNTQKFKDIVRHLSRTMERFLPRRYSPKHICMTLDAFRYKKISFTTFLSMPGIEYDWKINRVYAGGAYYSRYPLREDPVYKEWRLNGMPEYHALRVLFDEERMSTVDFGWLFVQVDD